MKQTKLEKEIEWCLRRGETNERKHKGLRRVSPNKEIAFQHIEKAKRNLQLVEYLIKINYSDWAVSAIFYTMYHCLLAILWKYGYESKNQSCTFVVIEHLIHEKKIEISIDELNMIRESNQDSEETIIEMREFYQYGTRTDVEEQKIIRLQQIAKEFVINVSVHITD